MCATSVNIEPASLALRSNAARVLAQVLGMPPIDVPESADLARRAAESFAGPLAEALRALADDLAKADADPQALTVASTRLFVGPFEIAVSPYASWYLEPDRRMMGPVAERAAASYAEAGLQPGSGPREAPDHIAVELEFLYVLGFHVLTTEDPCWGRRLEGFWCRQARPWMGTFREALARAADHPVHHRVAHCLEALIVANG